MVLRSQSGWIFYGDWGEIPNNAHRVSKYALEIKLVFCRFYVFDIANTEIQT